MFLTFSAKGSPRDLRVFDETVSSMKVSWEPAPGNVLQYRLAYRPSGSSGPKKEISVKGDNTAALLKNLQPGTQYDISISARYPSGLGDALEGRGTTLEGKPDTILYISLGFKVAVANTLTNISADSVCLETLNQTVSAAKTLLGAKRGYKAIFLKIGYLKIKILKIELPL